MSERVILLGAGGHARVVLEALERLGTHVAGVVANELSSAWPSAVIPHLGDDGWLVCCDKRTTKLVNGIGGLAPMGRRAIIFERFKELGFNFMTVVHPAATVAHDASIGEGSFIAAGAVVQVGGNIGANCVINTGAIVDHDVRIEGHAQIAPGAVLAGHVLVQEGAYVGAGATVLQGLKLGASCQVGAGALVLEDVAPRTLVLGAPARERAVIKRSEQPN